MKKNFSCLLEADEIDSIKDRAKGLKKSQGELISTWVKAGMPIEQVVEEKTTGGGEKPQVVLTTTGGQKSEPLVVTTSGSRTKKEWEVERAGLLDKLKMTEGLLDLARKANDQLLDAIAGNGKIVVDNQPSGDPKMDQERGRTPVGLVVDMSTDRIPKAALDYDPFADTKA